MKVVDRCLSAETRITITDMLPVLIEAVDSRPTLSLPELQAELTAMDEFEQVRIACPRIWQKALRRELKLDDPFLTMMLQNIDQMRGGTKTKKDAWRQVEERVTDEFVTKKIGAPDQYGRPSKQ